MAGAGAAGPALEGGVVKTGMRAVEGAVSYVRLGRGGGRVLRGWGGGEPWGPVRQRHCGSDCSALPERYGGPAGKLIPESGGLEQRDGEWAVCYAPGLYFFTKATSTPFSKPRRPPTPWWNICWTPWAFPWTRWGKFFVAGAFGTYLDKESAVTIGLYPDLPRDRIVSAGNTSLEGSPPASVRPDNLGRTGPDSGHHGICTIR